MNFNTDIIHSITAVEQKYEGAEPGTSTSKPPGTFSGDPAALATRSGQKGKCHTVPPSSSRGRHGAETITRSI